MPDDVDPRYDPQFQRGFSGPTPLTRPVAERAEARDPDRSEPQPGPGRPLPGRPLPVPPETLTAPAEDAFSRDPSTPAQPIVATAPVLVERPLTANPFVWGLLVAGIGLAVAGAVTFAGWSLLTGRPTQQIDYALLQFLIGITPVLLGLGGATLLGVGFLFAVDRQRRTRTPAVANPPAGLWVR